MDSLHAHRHVQELRKRVAFLRTLRPGNPSYLVWIGDIAELANTVWGIGAPQPLRLAEALRSAQPNDVDDEDHAYRRRVEEIDAVLAGYEQELSNTS
jgi:hypothetical protein